MCVIAGYLGNEPAAPILLEMLRREEGLAGGFYSGIVTLHEGVLHHAKVVGDVETLIANTPALQLPGTIGLAHSRTPSGGGQPWAHPFIDAFEKLAYIANGAPGAYKGKVDFDTAAQKLFQRGYTFSSAQKGQVGNYPMLSDGSCVHASDILCQSIAANFEDLPPGPLRLLQAASATYQELPGAIVGLCLHLDHPDEIVGARHNKPMEIGRLGDGSYVIASSTLAFPEEVEQYFRAPAMSGLRLHRKEGIQILPFENRSLIPVGLPPSAAAVSEVVINLLREKKSVAVPTVRDAVVPLWPSGVLDEKEVLVFPLLAALAKEGKIELCDERVPGVDGQGTVPRTIAHWRG
ncbi:MAG TPA: hypothetical protein VNQ90_16305 [Chthoniobacteraceae bacterium]|nr:hypothetical protein [Chthoniobacteraceae bacterium]